MKRAALYARVSTADQTTANQLLDLRQMVEQRGYQVVEEYVDHGISGAKARRPALDRMMKDARRGRFSVVVVWAFDRLARTQARNESGPLVPPNVWRKPPIRLFIPSSQPSVPPETSYIEHKNTQSRKATLI